MKVYKCDKCGIIAEGKGHEAEYYPEGWSCGQLKKLGEELDLCSDCLAAEKAYIANYWLLGKKEAKT